jgi:RND family efflux transporter MFP subunit
LKRLTILVLVLLFSFLLSGCGSKPPSGNENSPIAVKVAKVTRTDLEKNYNTSGQIEASSEATIAPKVSGRVAEVNVKLGDRVKKGQVLFRVEDKEAQNQLTQSKADLAIAKTSYDSAAQALKDARSNYDRYQTLNESGAVAKSDFEQATTTLVNAEISLEKALQQVDQAQATLSNAQDDLNDYSVTAPGDGFVGVVNVEIGEMVSSQTDAAIIVSIDTVKVKASVPESVVNTIKKGSKVPVIINSLNKSVEGTVTAVSPRADSTTMGYPAEIALSNPSGEIKPGMAAKIGLSTGTLKGVIALPVDAVIEKDGQHVVYIVENNKAREVFVETGESNDSRIEITKGLKEGQSVITEGNKLLSDGQQVKVVTEQEGGSK